MRTWTTDHLSSERQLTTLRGKLVTRARTCSRQRLLPGRNRRLVASFMNHYHVGGKGGKTLYSCKASSIPDARPCHKRKACGATLGPPSERKFRAPAKCGGETNGTPPLEPSSRARAPGIWRK
jgi:hypothetical protein